MHRIRKLIAAPPVLRASSLVQELFLTFGNVFGEVALIPGSDGIFEARHNDKPLSNKKLGRIRVPKYVTQQIRDHSAPDKDLSSSKRNVPCVSVPDTKVTGIVVSTYFIDRDCVQGIR